MAEFVSGSLDSVVFWEAKTLAKKRSAQPFPNSNCPLSSLTWNSTNTKLAVVPREGDRIAVCEFHDDIMTWSFLNTTEGSDFTSGCLLHNSRYLASGSADSSVHIWDLKNRTIFRSFSGHASPVVSVVHSHNDHWIVSGGGNGSIIMHTVNSSTPCQTLQSSLDHPSCAVNRLCFSHVEKGQLGSTSEDGSVCVWSVESQRLLHKYSSPHTGSATDLCFSPSNNMLMISVGMDSRIKCYDIQTRKIVTEVVAPSPLSSVTMLKDGSTLLVGAADGKLYVYELRTVKHPKTTLLGHTTAITCIAPQFHSKTSGRSRSSRSSSASKGKLASSSVDSTPSTADSTPSTAESTPEKTMLGEITDPFMATPVSNHIQSSSIFSPIDPNLVTPLTGKVITTTASAAHPTPLHMSSTLPSSPPAPSAAHLIPLHMSSTLPSSPLAPSAAHPTPSTPAPNVTHIHSVTPSSESSGIFSPLDSNTTTAHSRLFTSRQPVASPLLISHTLTEKRLPNMPIGNGKDFLNHQILNDKQDNTDSYDGGMTSSAGSASSLSADIHYTDPPVDRQSAGSLPVRTPVDQQSVDIHHHTDPSVHQSSLADIHHHSGPPPMEQRGTLAAPPPSGSAPPPSSGIQMKYLENMVKDAHEETLQALHQDIRALSVDNIKLFCTLQQQSAAQHAALVKKIDILSDELKQVQELVHRYMPKH